MTGATEWSGRVGDVWAAEWRRTDRSFAGLSVHLDAAIAAAAVTGASALDVGCGAGGTTLALATRRADVAVTGIDLSSELIAIAERRGQGVANVSFVVADASLAVASPHLPLPSSRGDAEATDEENARQSLTRPRYDLLCSRHGVMFFADPVAAFARLHAAASNDAALVFSSFRDAALNPWASDLVAEVTGAAPVPAPGYAPGPFAFADRDTVVAILRDAGWGDLQAEAVDYRYVAGAGDDPVADAASFLHRIGPIASALRNASGDARPAMLDKLAAALQKRLDHGEVAFPAAAWIWRARATGDVP